MIDKARLSDDWRGRFDNYRSLTRSIFQLGRTGSPRRERDANICDTPRSRFARHRSRTDTKRSGTVDVIVPGPDNSN